MKRFFAVSVLLIASLFCASSVMAAAFDVTANFGVRVAEKGKCEQIGSVTLSPKTVNDVWAGGTVITVELLGAAVLCEDIDFTTPEGVRVQGTTGNDFMTLTIPAGGLTSAFSFGTGAAAGATGTADVVCFNLANTDYNSVDPARQLVQVSYRDDLNNTYSGDIYVATVKPQRHTIRACTKAEGDLIGGELWTAYADPKDGLIEIPACDPAVVGQNQGDDCGTVQFAQGACLTLTDAGATFTSGVYNMTVTIDKAGIGIRSIAAYDSLGAPLGTVITETRDASGDVITVADEDDEVATKAMDVDVTLTGAGTVHLLVVFTYDSCTVTEGVVVADVAFNRDPCGDSFAQADLAIARVISCGDAPVVSGTEMLFPYLPNVTTGWWAGISFTNLAAEQNVITVTATEADGDVWTSSITLDANVLVAGAFTASSTVVDNGTTLMTFTTTSDDAQLGDERFRLEADAAQEAAGFAMLGDGAQAQGYLPIMN
jgi:hypothetical protein